ncbi:hypothetical protein V3I05_01855 [Helicobacter mastomyrinus]|uniref:Uncharacterized protein n=1 Tax=Helicobacter mastomyrinus TaxID=287948 RepID=A0ABZ3F5K7_9HELI
MKTFAMYMLGGIIVSLCFMACGESKTQEEHSSTQEQGQIPFKLQGNENLDALMDKILMQYAPLSGNTHFFDIREIQADSTQFTPIDEQRNKIHHLLYEAYKENRAHYIESALLESVLGTQREWNVLSTSAQPYMEIPSLERLDTDIVLALSLLFLNDNKGDSSEFDKLLKQQYQSAKGSGTLSTIIESQIQARLLALYGLYHLDAINQNMEHLATHQVRVSLESDLEQYKDFILKEHFDVYQKAFSLLKEEILKQQAPMDRILAKLLEYPQSLTDNDDIYSHIEHLKNAYEIFKTHSFNSPQVQDIISIAQNPLKNVYSNTLIANYLYGLDYLSLMFLDDNGQSNIPLALDYLQKDFKSYQITQHRFDAALFQNYISSIFIGAYFLSQTYKDQVYFEELLRLIRAEISQYNDVMSEKDKELYQDALFILGQTDKSKFLAITFVDNRPKEEEGYVKIPLVLSPQENAHIRSIMSKEKNTAEEHKDVCLNPSDISFMLALTYQAYKMQGFEGVAPEMFQIRLDEVFDIEQFRQLPLSRHLIDFDTFMVLGVADKQCYAQELDVSERLAVLEAKEQICGYNLYFDKENGFVVDDILPSRVLEQTADGNIYYRLKVADMNLNQFLFHNDENALSALKQADNTGEILPVLLTFFPHMQTYLNNRLLPNEADEIIKRATPRSCK